MVFFLWVFAVAAYEWIAALALIIIAIWFYFPST